ncbi:MAG: MBL fold metallo-hydrolase [Clostridia bacterium]|nr:MBL fold metallo-hydrolase [Clostridia bacterium]
MLINYYGHSYFLIEGENYSIALDPFSNIGLLERVVSANYVFCSHNHYDHNNVSIVNGATKIIKSENCFEIIPSYHDEVKGAKRGENNVLKFTLDGKVLVFMGDIGVVDNNVIEKVKGCDYLFVPVGGVYTVNYLEAKRYVDEINPKVVVPMHYKLDKCTVNVDKLEKFLSKFDSVTTVSSPYKITGNEKSVLVIKAEI